MYFDPDWIFAEKPEKQYPNITGLMQKDKWPPAKKQRAAKPITDMADVFTKSQPQAQPKPEQKSILDRIGFYINPMNFVKNQISKNIYPFGYQDSYRRAFSAIFLKDKGRAYAEESDLPQYQSRMDFLNVYTGKPQQHNTLSPSTYKPTMAKDPNAQYYRINDDEAFAKYLLETIKSDPEAGDQFKIHPSLQPLRSQNQEGVPFDPNNRPILDYVQNPDDTRWIDMNYWANMGTYVKSLGKDEKGKYVSYYDKWDIEPMDFGTPFELYDRIYYTVDGNGNAVRVYPSESPSR